MKKIGPKHSTHELLIRKIVSSLGYRYGLHRKNLPGKPDLTFPKFKKVIFVNGCFWHGHRKCDRSKLPTTNKVFWKSKIDGNIKRDKRNKIELKKLGWDYLEIWQCEINKSKEEKLREKIKFYLKH